MADFAPGLPKKEVHGDLQKLKPGEFVDFVVQKHLARKAGEHLDMRLGSPSTGLYSWATRKDLPGPGGKIALFRQPLHRHEYKDFQGEIPEGYGAGKVSKADEGKLLVNKVSDKILHFTRADKKHPERFALVAPKEEGKPWLLVNNTPTEPVPYEKIRYTKVHPDHAETILGGLQPGSSVQAKIDGAAALTKLMDDKLEVVSYRTAKETGHPIVHTERVFKGPATVSIPKKYVGSVLRQELYGERKGKTIPAQELGGLLNSSVLKSIEDQKKKDIELRNLVFDIQQLGKSPTKDLPYERRMELVKEVLEHLPQDRFYAPEEARTPEAARELYERIRSGKHPLTREGIVVHPPVGKPSKVKFVDDHDVYITGTFPAEKGSKYEGRAVGGFTYSLKPGGPTVGKVGTGFSDQLRRDLLQNSVDYVGRVARIRAQEQHPSGAFRSPSLISLHEDYPLKKTSALQSAARIDPFPIMTDINMTSWDGFVDEFVKIAALRVEKLTKPEQIEGAKALERKVFGGAPRSNRLYEERFGVYKGKHLIAATCVNKDPLTPWRKKNDEALPKLEKLKPDIWITATMTDPKHRGEGAATLLRDRLKREYGSILTGTGSKSDQAMQHLNVKAGFKKVLERGKTTIWHWSEKTAEVESYKNHGHPRAPVGSVAWHFHNYEHGYKHCKGSPSNPYSISHHKDFHVIDQEYARGHGINRKPTWFRFTENLGPGQWVLESGVKVEGMKKTSALQSAARIALTYSRI